MSEIHTTVTSTDQPTAMKHDEDPAIFRDIVLDPELLRCTLVTKRLLTLECLTETHTSQSLVRIPAPSPVIQHVPFHFFPSLRL